MFEFLKRDREEINTELYYVREYVINENYSTKNKQVDTTLEKLFKKFRKEDTENKVYLKSKFNGKYYQFHDIDDDKMLETFKKIFDTEPYVIFSSSPGHYWGILDKCSKDLDTIYKDTNWRICNDSRYVSCQQNAKDLVMRGIYETEARKPKIFEQNLTDLWSKEFKLFINKLERYFKNEGLELSILRYKDQVLLTKFNRSKKLEKLEQIKQW